MQCDGVGGRKTRGGTASVKVFKDTSKRGWWPDQNKNKEIDLRAISGVVKTAVGDALDTGDEGAEDK